MTDRDLDKVQADLKRIALQLDQLPVKDVVSGLWSVRRAFERIEGLNRYNHRHRRVVMLLSDTASDLKHGLTYTKTGITSVSHALITDPTMTPPEVRGTLFLAPPDVGHTFD